MLGASEQLQAAGAALRAGGSIRAVAARFNLKKSTLGRWWQQAKQSSVLGELKQPDGSGNRYLSAADEAALVRHIKEWQSVGKPLTGVQLRTLVGRIMLARKPLQDVHKAKPGPVSDRWVKGFLSRHPELVRRKGGQVELKRCRAITTMKLSLWQERFKALIRLKKYVALFNADETGFSGEDLLRRAQLGHRIGEAGGGFSAAEGDYREHWSAMVCVGTRVLGTDKKTIGPDILPPLLIFKGKRQASDTLMSSFLKHSSGEARLTVTDSASMNQEKFVGWFEKVRARVRCCRVCPLRLPLNSVRYNNLARLSRSASCRGFRRAPSTNG